MTSAGISAGIERVLWVVVRRHGEALARATARHMEYSFPRTTGVGSDPSSREWLAPGGSGSPQTSSTGLRRVRSHPDDLLAEVLTLQQPDQFAWGVLKPVRDVLPVLHAALASQPLMSFANSPNCEAKSQTMKPRNVSRLTRISLNSAGTRSGPSGRPVAL